MTVDSVPRTLEFRVYVQDGRYVIVYVGPLKWDGPYNCKFSQKWSNLKM